MFSGKNEKICRPSFMKRCRLLNCVCPDGSEIRRTPGCRRSADPAFRVAIPSILSAVASFPSAVPLPRAGHPLWAGGPFVRCGTRPFHSFAPPCFAKTGCTRERQVSFLVNSPFVPLVCTTLLRQDRLHSGASGEFPASTPRPFHSFAPLCFAKIGCTRERQVSFLRQLPARSTRLHYLCTLKICPWIPPHRSTA